MKNYIVKINPTNGNFPPRFISFDTSHVAMDTRAKEFPYELANFIKKISDKYPNEHLVLCITNKKMEPVTHTINTAINDLILRRVFAEKVSVG